MRVDHRLREIVSRRYPQNVTEKDADDLIEAAEKDNKAHMGCCSGLGTEGTDYLFEAYQADKYRNKFTEHAVTVKMTDYFRSRNCYKEAWT